MGQLAGGPGLSLEAAEALGVGGEGGGEDLDSHVALQPRVPGAIDLTHAPGAEGRQDPVRAKLRARHEGHDPEIIRLRRARLGCWPVLASCASRSAAETAARRVRRVGQAPSPVGFADPPQLGPQAPSPQPR